MPKRNEDSVERFFRKAVSHPDTPFQEADWQKMEKMLDEEAARRSVARSRQLKRVTYTLVGLSILFSSIYFLISDNHSTQTSPVSLQEKQAAVGAKSPQTNEQKKNPAASLLSPSSALPDNTKTQNTSEDSLKPMDDNSASKNETRDNRNRVPSSSTTSRDSKIKSSLPGQSVNTEDQAALPEEKSKNSTTVTLPGASNLPGNTKTLNASEITLKPIDEKSANENEVSDNRNGERSSSIYSHDSKIKSSLPGQASNDNDQITIREEKNRTSNSTSVVQSDASGLLREHSQDVAPVKVGGQKASASGDKTPTVPGKTDQGEDKALLLDQNKNREITSAGIAVNASQEDKALSPTPTTSSAEVETRSAKAVKERETEKMNPEEEPVSSPTETQKENDQETKIPSRWSIALALAPDFSTTKLNRFYEPGKYVGLMIGYQVIPRMMITTGVLLASKQYKSNGKEYAPPSGYWARKTNGVIPDQIKGTCTVWEIPLLIQFNALQSPKGRLYVSAGASSYIMQHEAYQYTFDTPNPGASPGWNAEHASKYWLSIGHLSAGYERQLFPRVAVGIEPFLKIPFSGIGWSKLDLYTTGAYINVRYRIVKKNM